jgi:hypothetical protein
LYDVKRRGPRTEPWGTPVVTDALIDDTPLTKLGLVRKIGLKPVQSPITDSKLVGKSVKKHLVINGVKRSTQIEQHKSRTVITIDRQ